MIHRVLMRKYIGQSMLLFLACATTLFAFAWVRVWVVSLLDMGQFKTILDQFREFEKFAPIEFDALFTYAGRVGMTYDEPIVILCTVVWCISRGSDVVSGELNRGTLEMMLAQPIRRITLLATHATVSIGGLALLCLMVWGGITVGIQATTVTETIDPPSFRIPMINIDVPLTVADPATEEIPLRQRVNASTYAAATFSLFAFGFFLLGLSSMFSTLDRYRWRTVGAVVGVYILQLVMFGLGKAAASLDWLLSMTFFSCYKPQKMTSLVSSDGLGAPWSLSTPIPDGTFPPLVYPLMLIILGAVCYAIGARHFSRRDLPAPL